nr:hypothetical protein CFP56_66999 [Quercus suber]
MTGTLKLGLDDGTTADAPFCVRCVVDEVESEKPRLQLWQTWIDNTPFINSGILSTPSIPSGILDTIGGR